MILTQEWVQLRQKGPSSEYTHKMQLKIRAIINCKCETVKRMISKNANFFIACFHQTVAVIFGRGLSILLSTWPLLLYEILGHITIVMY